ncbi:hypothetical protein [Metasolibacillus sp.]|uniref:hypothetical protein n=1 Tax=Metasolibacillus sp. TaxID=2703680 RepID=UPI0025E84416|nr:hypothetical protein [Metasolibacillus sp.]MCT6923338.1 hypothetical protein [Metasolibacillus sp.]MCT6939357.1 hypothetical protein [Metasolibacillus sp.]
MNQKLWEVIQLFKEKNFIGQAEWAYAEEVLDTDMFQLLKEQMEGKIQLISEQWK